VAVVQDVIALLQRASFKSATTAQQNTRNLLKLRHRVPGMSRALSLGMSTQKTTTVTEINLTKTSKDKADRIAMRLRGQTSMDFYVNVCPCNGSFLVNVGTLRANTSIEELTEMVLDVLASMIAA
jgi:hypothetical protein